MMIAMGEQWKLEGIMRPYNRGGEGLSLGRAENRRALPQAGFPVMIFEGHLGEGREFDAGRTRPGLETFMETLGTKPGA